MDFSVWQTFYIYLFCHVLLAEGMSQTHIQEEVVNRGCKSDFPRREIIMSLTTGRRPKTDDDFHRALTELLLRNVTSPVSDMDLGLFMSALVARGSALNPEGIDLVADLLHRVDQKTAPRPYLVLTLCNSHAVQRRHLNGIQKLISRGSKYLDTRELETDALILKALACSASLPNAHAKNLEFRECMVELAKKIAETTNFEGNVYTTSLVVQALTAYNVVVDPDLQWKEKEALSFLRQESDSASLTKSYYIQMAINSRRVPFLKNLHKRAYGDSQVALRKIINCTLALRIEGMLEMDFAVQMRIPAHFNLHEVIRRASNLTSRFQLESAVNLKGEPLIVELDGIPNDPERGLYWRCYSQINEHTSCSISSYFPADGETVVLFYGSEN